MNVVKAIFLVSAITAVLAAGSVVVAKNPVRAVLSLVLTFVATAVTWLIIEAEFLAISLILVYVGAVMVLFLFVVMMLDIELEPIKQAFARYFPLGILVAGTLLSFLLLLVYLPHPAVDAMKFHPAPEGYSNVRSLGEALYTDYLFAFECAGVILLIAMVAAIALTFRGSQLSKKQNILTQLRASKSDRVTLVDLPRGKP